MLPLKYEVSYLQHEFQPDDAYLGYVPSSWLKFALPASAPLDMPIADAAVLPIPLIQRPVTQVLARQGATGAPLPSTQGPNDAQQKIAAARDAGAELFLVPADNCDGIGGVATGDMRLAKATTMHGAVETLADWVTDHDARLPSCEDTAS